MKSSKRIINTGTCVKQFLHRCNKCTNFSVEYNPLNSGISRIDAKAENLK